MKLWSLVMIILLSMPLRGMFQSKQMTPLENQFNQAARRGGLYKHDSKEDLKRKKDAAWVIADAKESHKTFLQACFPVDLEVRDKIVTLITEYYAFNDEQFFIYIPVFATLRPIATDYPIEMLVALSSYQVMAANREDCRLFLFDIKENYNCTVLEPNHDYAPVESLTKCSDGTIVVKFTDTAEITWDPKQQSFNNEASDKGELFDIPIDDDLTVKEVIELPLGGRIICYLDRVQFPDKLVTLAAMSARLLSDQRIIFVTKNSLQIWDAVCGKHLKTIKIPEYSVLSVSPITDDCVACFYPDTPVKLWSLITGTCIQSIGTGQQHGSLIVMPDSCTLVLAGNKIIYVYRLEQPALDALASLSDQEQKLLKKLMQELNLIKEKNRKLSEPIILAMHDTIARWYNKLPEIIQGYLKEYYNLITTPEDMASFS